MAVARHKGCQDTHTHTHACVFVCLASRLFVIRLKGIAGISLCGTRISPFLAKLHDKSRPKVVPRDADADGGKEEVGGGGGM